MSITETSSIEPSAPEADLHPDPFWQAVCGFIARNSIANSRIVAPREFGSYLDGAVPYDATETIEWSDIDGFVIHKGWLDQLPPAVLDLVVRTFVPAFANEVFVVYARTFFEPILSADHVRSFLERLPRQTDTTSSSANIRPLAVYAGHERLICRDVQFRKILTPARNLPLIGAVMAGTDVVGELSAAIAPAMEGAAKVIDYGGGIGLFALAAKEVMQPNADHIAIEPDDRDMAALRANMELSGLFWRTVFFRSSPTRLRDVSDQSDNTAKLEWVRAQQGRDMDARQSCDSLHIDLDLWLASSVRDLGSLISHYGLRRVVLSRGLSSRPAAAAIRDEFEMAQELRKAGLVPLGEKSLAFGSIRTWGSNEAS